MAEDVNTFAGGVLDRAGALRRDASWVAARLADPASRALVVARDGVFLAGADEGPLRPALAPLPPDPVEPVLLGLEPGGAAVFAVDGGEGPDGSTLTGLRDAAARLDPAAAGLVAHATAMLNWHRRHRHCANCGTRTVTGEGGYVRTCPECGASHHPRTDPVVIMLVTDGDRVLLGRQPSWPAGRYSALAGFVEPGETLEAAVAREVLEESGVTVADARYVSSQPWPFPASLMLGFTAVYTGGEAVAADGELDDARWFTREELAAAVAGEGELRVPPPVAIARRLIDAWLAERI
ncbi:MAG: NADH pyrophosphatase, decaps 5'-NAD modified RNA [uncultured Solirubrobacteraceae bacterium]|uniref:NAD(+) diphosphatase n=1 Tax=uncultured Solirubrobacteraceae bacterium TaxID=1162706 RepID=A0A6J4RG79_9ACTN|nr:MAG: NADH pyrophosphatase, decaps 5'-NAD modified RNA [uncultured Solirubrobacteraceae bacterium]